MPPLRPRPYERRTLENLLETQGLSGGTAYDIFSGVQGSALERLAHQQALRMQRRQTRQELMPQLADFTAQTALGGLPSSVTQTAFSGYGGAVQSPLQELIEDLYPAGASTSPYAQTTTGGGLDSDDLSSIDDIVMSADPSTAHTGDGRYHTALMNMLTRLKALGYSATATEAARRYFDARWRNAGGPEPTEASSPGLSSAGTAAGSGMSELLGGTPGYEFLRGLF